MKFRWIDARARASARELAAGEESVSPLFCVSVTTVRERIELGLPSF
jgi:hypothetical protein